MHRTIRPPPRALVYSISCHSASGANERRRSPTAVIAKNHSCMLLLMISLPFYRPTSVVACTRVSSFFSAAEFICCVSTAWILPVADSTTRIGPDSLGWLVVNFLSSDVAQCERPGYNLKLQFTALSVHHFYGSTRVCPNTTGLACTVVGVNPTGTGATCPPNFSGTQDKGGTLRGHCMLMSLYNHITGR